MKALLKEHVFSSLCFFSLSGTHHLFELDTWIAMYKASVRRLVQFLLVHMTAALITTGATGEFTSGVGARGKRRIVRSGKFYFSLLDIFGIHCGKSSTFQLHTLPITYIHFG
jgi:hypothetical protein